MPSFNIGQFLLFCVFYSIKKLILPSNILIKGENTIVFRGEKGLKALIKNYQLSPWKSFKKKGFN